MLIFKTTMKVQNLLVLLLLTGLYSCSVDQTKETKLPDVDVDVDVDVEEGQLPSFDVDWADVNVGTKTQIVKVPKVRVILEEEEIEVPYIDVDMPESGEKEELTLAVEADIAGETHDLEIVKVYASGKRLYVISELKPTGQDLQDERMRISDRLIINAPDLDVKHYIVGKRPSGSFNNQYSYVDNMNALASKLTGGKVIYQK